MREYWLSSQRRGVAAVLGLSFLFAAGCVDMRAFEGRWTGSIVAEAAVRQGFSEDARVELLELSNVRLQGLTAQLTTSDGKFDRTTLSRITKAAGDALASLSFDGDPLRSYLLFAKPADADQAALMVLSMFGDEHIELRVISGNELFGVFYLRPVDEP